MQAEMQRRKDMMDKQKAKEDAHYAGSDLGVSKMSEMQKYMKSRVAQTPALTQASYRSGTTQASMSKLIMTPKRGLFSGRTPNYQKKPN